MLISSAATLLISCGGGSSTTQNQTPPPVNQSPSFTSAASLSLAEIDDVLVYIPTATDPQNDTVTISLLNQKDSSLFIYDPNGVDTPEGTTHLYVDPTLGRLRHEEPQDANKDNIYELTFRANDGNGNTSDLNFALTITDVDISPRIACRNQDLTQPVFVTEIPGTDRLAIIEKAGRIRVYEEGYPDIQSTLATDDFLDIRALVSNAGEQGLLGLAFSPEFETDRTFFVNFTNLSGDTEIRKYRTVDGNPLIADATSADTIMIVPQPRGNHNGGWMGFDAAGLLVIPMGDGGGAGDPDNLSQDTSSLLGKILRIDVTQDDFPMDDLRDYGIPTSNTFAGNPTAGREEIYAIGVRNPFRANFDPVSGDLIFGDVGQGAREEINRLPMNDASFNFGWNAKEGTADFAGTDSPDFTPPVLEYSHGSANNQGRSVTGGGIHYGDTDVYYGHYVLADFISGHIWALPLEDLVVGQTTELTVDMRINDDINRAAEGFPSNITSLSNSLYATGFGGSLYRIEPDRSFRLVTVIRQCS